MQAPHRAAGTQGPGGRGGAAALNGFRWGPGALRYAEPGLLRVPPLGAVARAAGGTQLRAEGSSWGTGDEGRGVPTGGAGLSLTCVPFTPSCSLNWSIFTPNHTAA